MNNQRKYSSDRIGAKRTSPSFRIISFQLRRAHRLLVLFVAALFLSSTLLHQVQAAAFGKLDRTFGGGRVTTNISRIKDFGEDVVIQRDGRIVVAGSAGSGIGLARYNTDGSLDTSFGEDGKVTTSFDSASALAIQPDGRIVVAGSTYTSRTLESLDIALARYEPDGSLDTSFGIDGKVTTDFFGDQDWASGIGIRPDGRIVVAGAARNPAPSFQCFALAQYNTDGSLDTSFGTGGKATTRFTEFGGTGIGYAHGLAIQSDGTIVAVGTAYTSNDQDFALVRFLSYGSLDISFGMGGKVVTDFSTNVDDGISVAIQPNGQIVVAGSTFANIDPNTSDFALARYNSNGSLDLAFGTGGKITTDLRGSFDYASDLAIQPDGDIVLAGSSQLSSAFTSGDFALTRYHPDGSLDTAFGVSGIVITDFHANYDVAAAIAIQQDGRLVAAGTSFLSSTDAAFALARYR